MIRFLLICLAALVIVPTVAGQSRSEDCRMWFVAYGQIVTGYDLIDDTTPAADMVNYEAVGAALIELMELEPAPCGLRLNSLTLRYLHLSQDVYFYRLTGQADIAAEVQTELDALGEDVSAEVQAVIAGE